MHSAATERLEFAPPPVKGSLRALALALFVHLLLIAALTWGVNWKHSEEAASFEAELWSGTAQQAAPGSRPAPPQLTPPQPAAEPERRPEPTPPVAVAVPRPAPVPPPRPVKAPQAKPAPSAHEADIALEKEKEKKRQQLAQKAAELQQAKKLQEKQQAEQALAQRKTAEKAAQAEKAAEQKLHAKALEKENLAAEKRRLDALNRMMGIAATSGTNATGSSAKSSGPSANYKGRLSAVFKRNISFSNIDSIQGNPKAVVQVKVSPNGLIISFNLTKSSGVPAWDDAVLRAVEKTERIPLDEDGKVVPEFPVQFGPKD